MKRIDFNKKMTYLRALLLPFRITPVYTTLLVFNDVINMVLPPLQILVTSYFIDTVIMVFQSGTSISKLVFPLLGMVAITLYGYAVGPIVGLMNKRREHKNWLAIDHQLLPTYAGLEIKHIENSNTMDLIIRIWSNAPHMMLVGIWEDIKNFIVQAGTVAGYLAILVIHAPLVGGMILVASIPIILLARKCGKERYSIEQDETKNDRLIDEMQYYQRDRRTVNERSLFDYTDSVNEKIRSVTLDSQKHRMQIQIKNSVRKHTASFLLTLFGTGTIFMLLPSLTSGRITVGLYISLIGGLFATINHVAWNFSSYFEYFTENRAYLKEFNEYISLTKEDGVLDEMSENIPVFQTLEFRNVSFTYPGTDKKVLDDLSFVLESGKRYSLVGVNGSGKTTITKLILRMYQDYEGEILLNDIPLRDWRLADIKAMFTAVFQDFIKYDVSLSDNIDIGTGLRADENEIEQAINVAGLRTTVEELPKGKDTMLGKIYDDGVDLSGGQWQKIAIARAVISRAQLKILDEPTASLDPVSERNVYRHFDEISREATTLFISHRLASAKMADTILVLQNGKIAESGTHEQLMAQKGLYAEMFESQKGWYV